MPGRPCRRWHHTERCRFRGHSATLHTALHQRYLYNCHLLNSLPKSRFGLLTNPKTDTSRLKSAKISFGKEKRPKHRLGLRPTQRNHNDSFQMALTTPFFRVKMQQINHYTIAKKTGLHSLCLHGFSSIFHARFHRKNERNPVHSFYGLVHSFLRRCWFISKVLRLFRKIFAFFASYSAIIFDGLALGWYQGGNCMPGKCRCTRAMPPVRDTARARPRYRMSRQLRSK